MKPTGESTDGLRKVNDLLRMFSIIVLGIHIYYFCYGYFQAQGYVHNVVNEFLAKIGRTPLFENIHYSKAFVYFMILISAMGMGVKKRKKLNLIKDISFFVFGTLIFFFSFVILNTGLSRDLKTYVYAGLLGLGYLMVMGSASRLPRHIHIPTGEDDVFNEEGESFPQEQDRKENQYSINYRLRFKYKKKIRNGFINVVNPFRAMLVMGVQGSGKTYSIINEAIRQMAQKGFTLAVYDFKFSDLSTLAYNALLKNQHQYQANIKFYVINFEDVQYSHRCNPLLPEMMHDFSDAVESAKSIMLNLNKSWITRQGDFFVESPINYLASIIWYLKLYEGGRHCTLPHVIEMVSAPIQEVIPLLASEPELETIISPFYSSLENNTLEQLEGMIDSARIPLTRLASQRIYYVMSGNEFTLDINNPEEPKFVCFGNHDDKKDIYGACLGLYFSRMLRLINQKGQNPTGIIFDELPTVYVRGIDSLMATARSNKIATILGFQDIPQLERDYGQKVAESIFSIVGNIFCGQVMFNTAEKVSRLFGRNKQTRVSFTTSDESTSFNTSSVMDQMIPASKLTTQSQGEMAGIVADNIDQKTPYKIFKGQIMHDDERLAKEEKNFAPIPQIRAIDDDEIENNFYRIKVEVKQLMKEEYDKLKVRS